MASRNNEEGSSSEKPKGSSSSPPCVHHDDFLATLAHDNEPISELKKQTWFQNDWTHEEDSLLNDLLTVFWTREELDGSSKDLFKKYGNDEMYRRYGQIAKCYFPKRSDVDVSWRHLWFKFKKAREAEAIERESSG